MDERTAARYLEAKPGRYVILTVADSGMGIPPEVIDKIFEPFFTTKDIGKGTGLGLSTVVAITKSHDGFLDLHSAPNRGTEFNLFLPALQPRAGERDDTAVRESFQLGHGETVLVMDDELPILSITCETLESFGYRTLRACDGAEAVRIYEQHAGEISVVLTDITMPKMDGPATIRTLREINPDVKCIVSSGYLSLGGNNGSRSPLTESGNFLPKPYTAETLLNTVRRALEGKAGTNNSA